MKIFFYLIVAFATFTLATTAPTQAAWENEFVNKIVALVEANIQSMKDHQHDTTALAQDNCNNGDARLRGGSSNLDGRVEVCENNVWGRICSTFFEIVDANVVCRQLGFYVGSNIYYSSGGQGPILRSWVECKGSEATLLDCASSGFHCDSPVGVTCADDNICNVFTASSGDFSQAYYSVWRRRLDNGLAALPEGETKKFLTEVFLPDLKRIEENYNGQRKESMLNYLLRFYSAHPILGCDFSDWTTYGGYVIEHSHAKRVFARSIWDILEQPSKEFKEPFETGYSNQYLHETKILLNLFSLKKGYNLPKEIDEYCFPSAENNLFCTLAEATEVYRKIEQFVDSPEEKRFNLVSLNLIALPIWNPTGELPAHHFLENAPRKSAIYITGIQTIVNEVKKEDFRKLEQLQEDLPSYTNIRSCSSPNTPDCILHSLISQLTSYVNTVRPKRIGGVVHKTIYAEIDYKSFLNQQAISEILKISRENQNTLLDVGAFLHKQIQCTGDQVASSIFKGLSKYFSSLHSFDATKSNHDIVYVDGRVKDFTKQAATLSSEVDEGIEAVVIGAIVCAAQDLAYKAIKLAIKYAAVANPLSWLVGAKDLNDVLDAIDDLNRAIVRLIEAERLVPRLSEVRRLYAIIVDGFVKNHKFLSNVKTLVDNIDHTGNDFEKTQKEFLKEYGDYNPAITKPQLTELGNALEALITAACDIIEDTDAPTLIIYKSYVARSGICWKTAVRIQKMMELYAEIYDFQFELIEALATHVRAKTGLRAAQNLGSAWKRTVENCASLEYDDLRNRYAMLAGVSYASYQLQKWQAMREYCDVLEYQNAGNRPGICNGEKTDISKLVSVTESQCLGGQLNTKYYSVPLKRNTETSYKEVSLREDFAQLDIAALLAGESVHFQIPDSDWLIKHNFIKRHEKDYAIYVRQFEVYFPVESSFPTDVTIRAFSTAANHLVPGGTSYVIKPVLPLLSEYGEGHNFICKGASKSNPYSLCDSSKPPNICLAGDCLQQDILSPSIYTRWSIVANGYDTNNIKPPLSATDMNVQISMTLCKKAKVEMSQLQNYEFWLQKEFAEEESLTQCCESDSWLSSPGQCTKCPPGTEQALHGYFCEDINECTKDTDGCAQTCVNHIGSYTCACDDGYSLNKDGHSCDDINECDEAAAYCGEEKCTNFDGGYKCGDIDECTEDTDGCAQTCVNHIGSYTCACDDGYSLNKDGHSCDDINECDEAKAYCGEEKCTNFDGSYDCGELTGCRARPCKSWESCYEFYDKSVLCY